MKKILIFTISLLSIIWLISCDQLTTNQNTTNNIISDATTNTTNSVTSVITSSTEVITSKNTISQVTTIPITTEEVTTIPITTEEVTTIPITTEEVTTIPVTTEEVTTQTTTENQVERYQELSFYSINDFHGGTYSDVLYLEQIGAFLKNKKANDENTIILSNGDIFQGAALSNYYHGRPIVDVFNNIGFDGFVIGNHEFDWGIDEVLDYQDGNLENGEMNYPILAANIQYIDTEEPLENTVPYIIQEVSGVKVGIIGLIGEIIDSISATMVENIEFTDPVLAASNYAYELRENQDCDIVVVYIHNGSSINSDFASLSGQNKIDAVFNGHTHRDETSYIYRANAINMFYAQSNNYQSLFSEIIIEYDTLNEEVVSGSVHNYEYDEIANLNDLAIESILLSYENDTEYSTFVSELLSSASGYFSRSELAVWGSSVIRDYAGVDVGATNTGGFRHSLSQGSITMGDLIELYPFDNYINTCKLTGEQLLEFYNEVAEENYDVEFDDGLVYAGGNLYINDVLVESDTLYTVGAVDYIFNKTNYMFLDGEDITITTLLMRDLLAQDLLASNGIFNPTYGSNYQTIYYYDNDYYKELRKYL